MSIRLLVGLGNPGTEYRATRHNAGFWLVQAYANTQGIALHCERSFGGMVGKAAQAWVLLPQTYMNRSGQVVGAFTRFHKILPQEILVVHDELDLLPGVVKLKQGGGHAGHNGLKDIAAALGTGEFLRLRIGIGHPRSLNLKQQVVDFVLHAPRPEEQTQIDMAIDRGLEILPEIFSGNLAGAMQKLHSL